MLLVRRGIARGWRILMAVVGSVAAVLGAVCEVAWRGLLIVAATCMPIGGVLLATGQDDTSASLVTAAFALGILAVPCWFAARVCARIRPPVTLRRPRWWRWPDRFRSGSARRPQPTHTVEEH